jgi:hypothetical protein
LWNLGGWIHGFGFGGCGGIGTIWAREIPGEFGAGTVALFAFGLEFVEMIDFAEGAEEILAEIGVDAGFLGSDAAADSIEEDGF